MPDKIDLSLLRKAIRVGPASRINRLLAKVSTAQLALLLADLSPGELRPVLRQLMEADRLGELVRRIPSELLPQVLSAMDNASLAWVIEGLEPDDAVTLAQGLDEDRREEVLELADPTRGKLVKRLLGYSRDSAGRRMLPRFVAVASDATVDQAIRAIRQAADDVPVFYLYVLDEQQQLVGVVSLAALVKAADDHQVGQIMTTDVVSVPPEADQEEVARLVSRLHLLAIPVVADGQLLGLVTIDDVLHVLEKEATEDMYRMTGLSEGDRVFSPPHRSLLKRLPWNALNLLTSLVSAVVVSLFVGTIEALPVLAIFMPIVAGIGGNTGNQSLTVIIRGITLGELEFSSAWRALTKEVVVGLAIGVIMGTVVGCVAYVWQGRLMLGVVIAMAMTANLFIGALAATAIPLTLKRAGLDPALGSTILVTMCTDVFGFLSFLGLATLFRALLM